MSILNLTRKVLPAITKSIAQNRASVQNLPEMRLAAMMRSGDKSIVNVGMNECKAVRMLPGRINTIYTDGLAGCNSIGILAKGKDGNPVAILSHYSPLPNLCKPIRQWLLKNNWKLTALFLTTI